jgi:hypothetical protein
MNVLENINPFRPDVIVNGAEMTAPTAGTVLADTGPQSQPVNFGTVIKVQIGAQDSVPDYEVAHRNAANTEDIEVVFIPAASMPGTYGCWFGPAKPQERFVVRNVENGTGGKIYQASMYLKKS